MTTHTIKRRKAFRKKKPHSKVRGRLAGYLGAALLSGSLLTLPSTLFGQKENAAAVQKDKKGAEKTAKELLYTMLNYLKTGKKEHAEKGKELLDSGEDKKALKENFNKMLNKRLEGDPGLANFIDAYRGEDEAVEPEKLLETVEGLFSSESMDEAVETYGGDTVSAFKAMVLWRLAHHTVAAINNAFDREELPSAKEEYRRLEEEFKLFGKPLGEYPFFTDKFTKMFGDNIKPEFNELWQAYWKKFKKVSITQILEGMVDCRKILEEEGDKAAEKKYGEKFAAVIKNIQVPAEKLEEAPVEEETPAEETEEPPPELVEVGKIEGLPSYDKYVEKYISKTKKKQKPPEEKKPKKKKGKNKKKKKEK
jgi:outer membrane biosynthesis protein TonB